MTVGQLIKKLQAFDPDMIIRVRSGEGDHSETLEGHEIELVEDNEVWDEELQNDVLLPPYVEIDVST